MTWQIIEGDCRDVLRSLPAGSVHTCVTSPPYFGLRDYGTGEWEGGDPECEHRVREESRVESSTLGGGKATTGHSREGFKIACPRCGATRVDRQIGLEPTPDEFVAALVAVFREVRRVLRDDGTVWLNLGDSYNSTPPGNKSPMSKSGLNGAQTSARYRERLEDTQQRQQEGRSLWSGAKPKDLLGIPWMVAFALRADGWYLRSDIIWHKPNPMPESVTDRPTKAHEYVFLLSKGPRYFYDADAIREPHAFPDDTGRKRGDERGERNGHLKGTGRGFDYEERVLNPAGRNKRSVWTVATQPYAGAHFATFPPKLIEPCILAGAPERACGECAAPWVRVVEETAEYAAFKAKMREQNYSMVREGERGGRTNPATVPQQHRTLGFEPSCAHGDGSATGVVLDPFAGAGTTGMVALRHGRSFVGIELNAGYARMARERIIDDAPLLNQPAEVAA